MNAELLIETLNFIYPLSAALDRRFRESIREEILPKRTLLLREAKRPAGSILSIKVSHAPIMSPGRAGNAPPGSWAKVI